MFKFSTGMVDFKAAFAKLKSVSLNGPIMLEGVKVGATAVQRPQLEHIIRAAAGITGTLDPAAY